MVPGSQSPCVLTGNARTTRYDTTRIQAHACTGIREIDRPDGSNEQVQSIEAGRHGPACACVVGTTPRCFHEPCLPRCGSAVNRAAPRLRAVAMGVLLGTAPQRRRSGFHWCAVSGAVKQHTATDAATVHCSACAYLHLLPSTHGEMHAVVACSGLRGGLRVVHPLAWVLGQFVVPGMVTRDSPTTTWLKLSLH